MGKESESDNGREGKDKKEWTEEKRENVCEVVGAVNCTG